MTREEAIEILQGAIKKPNTKDGYLGQAIDIAIKALEPKPMEKFKSVKDHIFKLASDYKCWDNRLTDDEALELCHILEQKPRKGHWIECMPGGAEEWCYKCSECNFWKYKKTINLSKFSFCPNCGADMEVEK